MKGLGCTSAAIVAAALFASSVVAQLDPIVIKGSKFFYKTNGTQFFIKGVAYQQDFSANGTISGSTNYQDPLANPSSCARDVPLMQQLQTNTIRVYAINPTLDHSGCMKLLQDAGIYVISDLGEPATSINRNIPMWNEELYSRYSAVVDSLANYPNVIGFFAGNEVSNAPNNTVASAFVKAAVRDMKAYIVQKKYRPMGVGYATNDDETRTELANYFDCGPPEQAIDFWGYNIYSWCKRTDTYETSKYDVRTTEFASYNVPAFFAEYGCNTSPPRKFEEVQALYGSNMTKVWSGGIVYMYFQEANDFGLVSVGTDNKATKLPDFTAFSSQIAKVTPTGVQSASYSPTNSPQACPSVDATWKAKSDVLPPTPNTQLCGCMMQNLTCVAKSNLDNTTSTTQYAYVCDPHTGNYCEGINANATTGAYGAYSMCNSTERLSWAFNQFYLNQTTNNKANTNPCDFNSAATKQTPKSIGNCQALVSQAGPAGTGVVTSSPSGTGSSSSSSSTKSSAGLVTVPRFDFGMLQLAVYVTVAALVGAGMVLL